MKKKLISLVSLLFVVGYGSNNYQTVDSQKAYALINDYDVTIIDVRSADEYKRGHIVDAINIDVEVISDEVEDIVKDKSKKVLVYCQSGSRAKTASQKLVDLGYMDVYNIGGIVDWPYDIVGG